MSNFNTLPPEINASNIRGLGTKTMRIAQKAWKDLAIELDSRADEWVKLIRATKDGVFIGYAADKFREAAAEYHWWLRKHSYVASMNGSYLDAVANAYQDAFNSMMPLSSIATNRGAALILKSTNFLGQFAEKIAGLDSEYQDMWARNAEVMNWYHDTIFSIIERAENDGITPAPLAAVNSPGSVSSFSSFSDDDDAEDE